jgi:hypothetical protein
MTEVKTKQTDDNEVTKRLVKDETDNKTDDDDNLSSIKLFRKRLNEDTFYVEWDRFVTLAGSKSGLRVTLSYLEYRIN